MVYHPYLEMVGILPNETIQKPRQLLRGARGGNIKALSPIIKRAAFYNSTCHFSAATGQ